MNTAKESPAAIDVHRQDIDRIDRTIVALLAERMRIGLVLGEIKRAAAEPPRSRAREAAVLARVREAAAGPLSPASAERIFTAIIEETAACQAGCGGSEEACADAAYQGVEGSFSEDAARELLGDEARLLGCARLEEVFAAVAFGRARTAVVPLFNSIAGPVPGCAELIARHGLRIIGERSFQIVQSLIGLPGVGLDEIRDVHSHPVAIAQCRRFFRAHPRLNPVPAFDTAGSVAEMVRFGRRERAAIASARAAERWGAAVLAEAIQDCAQNITRFVQVAV